MVVPFVIMLKRVLHPCSFAMGKPAAASDLSEGVGPCLFYNKANRKTQ
jgi:hypothetical protein